MKISLDKARRKAEKWLDRRAGRISPNTIRSYRASFDGFFSWLEERGYSDVTQTAAADWLEHQKAESKAGRVAEGTLNTRIVHLNKFFGDLAKRKGKAPISLKGIKETPAARGENVLTIEEHNRMVEVCRRTGREREALLYRLLVCSGLRVGELSSVTVQALESGEPLKIVNKGRARRIGIGESLRADLLEYARRVGATGPVFFGRDKGKVLSQAVIRHHMKQVAKEAGVDPRKAYPHSERKLFAKRLQSKGVTLGELQRILGHASPDTTTRFYTVLSDKEASERAEELAKMIEDDTE